MAYANAILLPEESHLQSLFTAGPTMILALAIRLHWKKWRDTLDDSGSVSKDADQRFMDKLQRWTDTLVDGTFSPAQVMFRSALEALSVMLMYLIPVYVTLQFSAARQSSAEVTWSGVLLRYVCVALLTFLFVHLRSTNRIAARIFQEELRALKSLSTPLST